MRRAALVAAAVAVVLAGVAIGAVGPDGGTAGVSRVEEAQPVGPRHQCDGDHCIFGGLNPVRVELPAGVERVDVTVTVSMRVKVSRGDRGEMRVLVHEDGTLGGRTLAPGAFPVRTPGGRATSTTLLWTARDLPADGRAYAFELALRAQDGNGDDRFSATVRRHTVVVESWTAG